MSRPVVTALLVALAACAPPRASQFIGRDGSHDWWAIECQRDPSSCWRQANAACHDNFSVHELRAGRDPGAAKEPLELTVRGGTPPAGASIGGKVLVITCAAPTVPPRWVAGPECSTSPPHPNHCDDAAGEAFATNRFYLPPLSAKEAAPLPTPVDAAPAPDDALAELKTIADGLDSEVAAVAEPILAVDTVVKALHDFPLTYRVKASEVKAWAKASLGRRDVTPPPAMRDEIAADLAVLLKQVREVDAALRTTPDLAAKLLEKIARRHARVKVLADAASAPARATLASPSGSADEKSAADAHVAEIQALQVDARKKLDAIRTNVTNLSAQIMQALAKLGDATS